MFNTVTNIDSQNKITNDNDNDDITDNVSDGDYDLEDSTLLNDGNDGNDGNDSNDGDDGYDENSVCGNDFILQQNNAYTDLEVKRFIDCFSEDQQLEIFKIIKHYNEYYSTNNNGIFINLDTISVKCKQDICQFITFSQKKKQSLQKVENNIDKFKQIINDIDESN